MIAVDLFAGAGGFTTGAEAAGIHVTWAADFWQTAVDTHTANHPCATHVCQDLLQANWAELPKHDLLLASPPCTGHARARGKERPHHNTARSTAWAVVAAAETCSPPFMLIENVREFEKWTDFPEWSEALTKLGYTMSSQVIDAADLGVPQHRRRLFMAFSKSKAPLVLPIQTRPHTAIRSFIDLQAGRWSSIQHRKRPLAPASLARILQGRQQHGTTFLTSYYGTARGGHSLDKPLGTLLTKDRHALIDGDRIRMLRIPECLAAMGFPSSYWLPPSRSTALRLLGNAVAPPVAQELCQALLRSA